MMKIVIDIEEKIFEELTKYDKPVPSGNHLYDSILLSIYNGTPLPKGHGRLIDENDLKTLYELDDRLWWGNAVKEFTDLPTIIEADKEVNADDK